jgi:hypothetical protein
VLLSVIAATAIPLPAFATTATLQGVIGGQTAHGKHTSAVDWSNNNDDWEARLQSHSEVMSQAAVVGVMISFTEPTQLQSIKFNIRETYQLHKHVKPDVRIEYCYADSTFTKAYTTLSMGELDAPNNNERIVDVPKWIGSDKAVSKVVIGGREIHHMPANSFLDCKLDKFKITCKDNKGATLNVITDKKYEGSERWEMLHDLVGSDK